MEKILRRTKQVGTSAVEGRAGKRPYIVAWALVAGLLATSFFGRWNRASAQGPSVVDPNLAVKTVVSGLVTPTTLAFLGPNDMLVLEKNTGKVQRVINGVIQATPALDLAVNSASERGLLGIALDPNFPTPPFVYLYYTASSTGADTSVLSQVPLLGNRVDRFSWDGFGLTFDRNLIQLRALQQDAGQPERGNHNGGILRFGPDGKLYIYMGDNGRRGQMQNLPDGPFGGGQPDDQFGGPEPDNAHLTGIILRLNDDGSTPSDNPFFRAGALRGGEVGANLQKVFAYGIRNGFGMAFDPFSGRLWEAQNGDDSFTELNQVVRGSNLGWVQIMGPVQRLAQFKGIETSTAIDPVTGTSYFGLQQVRWPPTLIADSPEEALSRLFMVFEGGDEFEATLDGAQEVPPVATDAGAKAEFELKDTGALQFELEATANIRGATAAHIHLGGRGQNGPIVAFLFGPNPGTDFEEGDTIAEGMITDADVIARPGFTPTVANLVERMRQGRAYANLHTLAHPGGEIRAQITIADAKPVSRYRNPEFSWKFEVPPAGLGFMSSQALGPQYQGNFFTGAARTFLEGGQLFRFKLTANRRSIAVDDPRLEDRVADNNHKFDITESESLLFGRNFGIGTDIQTGPNGNLFVASLRAHFKTL